jgi:hypothetical protein
MLAVFGYGAQVRLCWHTVVGRAVGSLHALVLALQGCCQQPAVLLLRSVRAHLLGTERMHACACKYCMHMCCPAGCAGGGEHDVRQSRLCPQQTHNV